MARENQCSSLNCAHAFQCEGLRNYHTPLKLFGNTSPKIQLDIGRFALNMGIM